MENQTPNQWNSLLDQIIATSKEATNAQLPQNTSPTNLNIPNQPTQGGQPTPPKKPRDPMTVGMILKLIGTLFLVLLIFFGAFLAYIVFNPQEAGFFVSVFNVSPSDIEKVLAHLLHGSFGAISFLLSIVFLVTTFRAIWTPKEQKRKKLMTALMAVFSGILFFSILGFWAFLFQQLNASNFSNPNGNILIYDNDAYNDTNTRPFAEDIDTSNLIGPITLRYDISDNARQIAKRNGIKIESYNIQFDGAKCITGSDTVTGTDMDAEIICTFDTLKNYQPRGFYTVNNYNNEITQVPIPLEQIQVKWIIDITNQENKDGKNIRTYNASKVRNFGTPVWQYVKFEQWKPSSDQKIKESLLSLTPSDQPTYIQFTIEDSQGKTRYSRVFIAKNDSAQNGDGVIMVTKNPTNTQEYIFTLTGITNNPDEILSLDWKLNNSTAICQNSRSDSCSYIFTSYGRFNIEATVNLIGNQTKKVTHTFTVETPLLLERSVRVLNKENKLLNTEETFDPKTRRFVISGIVPPEKIFFDARDVIADNPGYQLKEVSWIINDGSEDSQKKWPRIELELTRTARYTVTAEYTFEKSIKTGREDDIRTVSEIIMLDMERKNLNPVLKIKSDSSYVPVRVTVDASESQSEFSEIVKFIYDFGEGRAPAEGDAIQTYTYTTAGDKVITVTIVDSNGERASTKQTLVLKDTAKTVDFTSSLSPAQINLPVDFTAVDNSGQVEDYLWNFGDNTPIKHGFEVSHTYKTAGTYNITLTIRYTDGTEKSANKKFTVVNSLE